MKFTVTDTLQSGAGYGRFAGFQAVASAGYVAAFITEAQQRDPRFTAISTLDVSFHGSPDTFEAVMIVKVERPRRGPAACEVRRPFSLCSTSSDEVWAERILESVAPMLGFNYDKKAA